MAPRQLSDEEKAEVNAMVEVAKSRVVVGDYSVAGALVIVYNHRKATAKLEATKSWTGEFVDNPAGSIKAGQIAGFSHRGSKGAVIYSEEGGAGYVVAWSVSNSPSFKVYVESGPLSQVYHNGWESAALAKIDSAGDESSSKGGGPASDSHATISDESGSDVLGVVNAHIG